MFLIWYDFHNTHVFPQGGEKLPPHSSTVAVLEMGSLVRSSLDGESLGGGLHSVCPCDGGDNAFRLRAGGARIFEDCGVMEKT